MRFWNIPHLRNLCWHLLRFVQELGMIVQTRRDGLKHDIAIKTYKEL